MKKRRVLLIVLAVILLIGGIGTGSFLLVTKGTVAVVDGIRQNSRVYIENAYYEDGKIYYTIVNDTWKKKGYPSGNPHMERKENGKWKAHVLWEDSTEAERVLGPFSRSTRSFEVWDRLTKDEIVGEYRLFFGYCGATEDGYVFFSENAVFTVGYLTITEDMLK